MENETQKAAKDFAETFSRTDLEKMQQACDGLRPRNSDKYGREEWFDMYKEKLSELQTYGEQIERKIQQIQSMTGDTKQAIRKAIAKGIRERQKELGLDQFLMNSVYLSIFRTYNNYVNS